MRFVSFLSLVLLSAFLFGCNGKQCFWINPDKSAKIEVEMEGGFKLSDVLIFSKGVDAWSDIKVEEVDGKKRTRFVAYVPDVTNYRLNGVGDGPDRKIAFEEDGTISIRFGKGPITEPDPAKAIDEEQARDVLAKLREQLAVASARIPGKTAEVTFHLPGEVIESSNFAVNDDGSLSLKVDLPGAFKAQSEMLDDEELMLGLIKLGERRGGPRTEAEMKKRVLGNTEPVMIKAKSGGKALFNYKEEVARAREGFGQELMDSGYYRKSIPPMPDSSPIGEIKVTGCSVKEDYKGKHIEVRMKASRTGEVVYVGRPGLMVATDESGAIVFPGLKTAPESGFANLAGIDKIQFRVNAGAPLETSKSLQSVKGVLLIGLGTKKKIESYGDIELKPGATTENGALLIRDIRTQGDYTSISCDFKKSPSPFCQLQILPEEGKPILDHTLEPGKGHKFSKGKKTVPLPEKAKVEVEYYEDFRTVEIPIDLKDIAIEK